MNEVKLTSVSKQHPPTKIGVEAAQARRQDLLDSRRDSREQAMAYCCCPEDGAELVAGSFAKARARDRDSDNRDSETLIVRCPRCRFWMRLFECEKHRPWMNRTWDTHHDRVLVNEAFNALMSWTGEISG